MTHPEPAPPDLAIPTSFTQVGDWIAALCDEPEDCTVGQIVELNGCDAVVAWASGMTDDLDLAAPGCEIEVHPNQMSALASVREHIAILRAL